jgi:hypothetical protein
MDKTLRVIVKEVLRKVRSMNEATTTGNVAGYNTPFAFSGEGDDDKKKKHLKNQGYTIVENRWLDLKRDVNRTPPRKIADGISNVNKQLHEIEKYLNWFGRIRKENQVGPDRYHKRTTKQLKEMRTRISRINEKLNRLSL